MHESSHCDCGCCADAHFGALLNQTSRLIRRALDARINAEVSSELSGVRGMVLGDIVRAERQGRDVYQRTMSGDIAFEPDVQRTIGVDVRYVLFVIDKFAGADWLLDEMILVKSDCTKACDQKDVKKKETKASKKNAKKADKKRK